MQNDSLRAEILAYANAIPAEATDRAFNVRTLERAFRATSGAGIAEILRTLADLHENNEVRINTNGEFEPASA